MDKVDEKMNDEYISNGAYEQYSTEYITECALIEVSR